MDAEGRIASVKTNETRNGNTRWTVVDDSGTEYTTFRPAIGTAAEQAEGKLARISFHEEERNGFRNVYLDGIEPVERQQPAPGGQESDSDPEEAAWRTAVDAAPYLLGKEAGDGEIEPEEAFAKLKPVNEHRCEDLPAGPDGAHRPPSRRVGTIHDWLPPLPSRAKATTAPLYGPQSPNSPP